MRILVIAAHPDDEVLGCGGTIARRCQEGDEVTIAIVGEGLTSRTARGGRVPDAELDDLRSHAREAARILGVSDVRFFGLPDNRLDTVATLDVIRRIEGLMDDVRPEVVYTQHGGDLNVDHGCVFRATLTACRPMADGPVRSLFSFEVASSTEWAFGQFSPVFNPNSFVDVSATLERKLEAMRAYRTEIREAPHPRSPEALRAAAIRWGSVVGYSAAEAFSLVFHRE